MKEKKKELRTIISDRLLDMTFRDVARKSKRIAEKFMTLPVWKEAEIIMIFLPMPGEIDTRYIIEKAMAENKQIAVPRMGADNGMEFHIMEDMQGPWIRHDYGILEPGKDEPVLYPEACPDSPLLMAVPGLAFDKLCHRLGRGKGFYDRYLNRDCHNLTAIGICFELQLVDEVPRSDHDQQLDGLVTEQRILFP